MIKHSDRFHGSDLEKIEQIYHIKREDIVSFSANVNPLGLSGNLKKTLADKLDVITTYPDREYSALRRVIGEYCNTDMQNIIVGNGSTELISLFIQIEHPKKALIVAPTYSEYEREISLGGGTALYYPLDEANDFTLDTNDLFSHLNETLDLLVICNPNNPTSTSLTQNKIRSILDYCKKYDIFVMIDETYVEFTENYKQVTAVSLTNYYNNLIILRGTSKFFAAPGLRLGYAITGNRDLLKEIHTRQNPWTISSLAEIAGMLMFTDNDYIEQTKQLINSERIRITDELKQINGLKVYTPSANFVLLRIEKENVDADILFDTAIRQKLMIRNCSTFPFLDNRYLRFCFMKPEQNDALLNCIRSVVK